MAIDSAPLSIQYFGFIRIKRSDLKMTIDDWARKVAAEAIATAVERAPMDAVLLAHLDDFEELVRSSRLKIPAFARALTRAGLTVKSGEPYSPDILRAQINRARTRRQARPGVGVELKLPEAAHARRVPAVVPAVEALTSAPAQKTAANESVSVLERLARLRPKHSTLQDLE